LARKWYYPRPGDIVSRIRNRLLVGVDAGTQTNQSVRPAMSLDGARCGGMVGVGRVPITDARPGRPEACVDCWRRWDRTAVEPRWPRPWWWLVTTQVRRLCRGVAEHRPMGAGPATGDAHRSCRSSPTPTPTRSRTASSRPTPTGPHRSDEPRVAARPAYGDRGAAARGFPRPHRDGAVAQGRRSCQPR
jgi:hypothetical protein